MSGAVRTHRSLLGTQRCLIAMASISTRAPREAATPTDGAGGVGRFQEAAVAR
jgi:hypothetical protein